MAVAAYASVRVPPREDPPKGARRRSVRMYIYVGTVRADGRNERSANITGIPSMMVFVRVIIGPLNLNGSYTSVYVCT